MVDDAQKIVAKEDAKKNRHENVVIEYARSMGEARKITAYSTGIGKYILDRVDQTLMAGTDIVEEYADEETGSKKIRLNKVALGLVSVPDIFDDLAVSAPHYYLEQSKVIQS